jgi:UPF0755 protein
MRSARIAALALALAACGGPPPDAPLVQFTVPHGATLRAISESLSAHQILEHPLWFRTLARLRRNDRKAQAGIYELRRGERASTLIRILTEGRGKLVRFTVPEGSTVREVATLAAEAIGLPADSVLAATTDTARLHAGGAEGPSYEGWLHPDTYLVPLTIVPKDLIDLMVRQTVELWTPAREARRDSLKLTRLGVLTLASIVEGEALVDDERPVIAGVYLNRLRLRMPLQADPTVQYGMELASGQRKPRLYTKDYKFPSPYNTYLHPGLPPGPVDSPGTASIDAVLNPASVPYLYFVAGPDGRHVFSRTYREHLRAIRQVRSGIPPAPKID